MKAIKLNHRIFSDNACVCALCLVYVCTGISGAIKDFCVNTWERFWEKVLALPWTDLIFAYFFGSQAGQVFFLERHVSFFCSVAVILLMMCMLYSRYTLEAAKIKWAATSSGLKWENAGAAKPTEGRELKNEELANKLCKKTEFTQEEWDSFGIQDLCMDNFIKAEIPGSYFQPAATSSGLKWENAGAAKPTEGRELKNEELANKLCKKTEFTQEEWDSFGIQDLCMDNFIKAEIPGSYFQPAATMKGRLLKFSTVIWQQRAFFVFAAFVLGLFLGVFQGHSLTAPGKHFKNNAAAVKNEVCNRKLILCHPICNTSEHIGFGVRIVCAGITSRDFSGSFFDCSRQALQE